MRLASLRTIGILTAADYLQNLLHYGFHPARRDAIDDAAAWGTVLSLLILYWAGYQIVSRSPRRSGTRVILAFACIFALLATFTIPYDSTDAFFYMAMGWAQTHYGMNPYSHVLREIPDGAQDPMLSASWMESNKNPWLDFPLVYGFAFASLLRFLAWLGNGNWALTLLLFKLTSLAAWAGVAIILWDASRLLGFARTDTTLYLFLWSPLILLHHIANLHNDLLVGFFVVLAVYCLLSGDFMWAAPALAAAVLIKYTAAPLMPIALVYVWRRRGAMAVQSALLSVSLAVICSVPYIGQIMEFKWTLVFGQLSKITAGSLFAAFYYSYRAAALPGLQAFGSALKMALWAAVLVYIAAVFFRLCRKAEVTVEDIITASSTVLFAVICIASSQFYAWYIGMFFPLVLLLNERHWLRRFAVILGGAQLTSLTSLSRKGIGYFVVGSGIPAAVFPLLTKEKGGLGPTKDQIL